MTASDFIALPDEQKEQIFEELERQTPERRRRQSTPLTPRQRAAWRNFKKPGRPEGAKETKVISVIVEKGLLEKVDRYAKRRGMTRAQLIAQGMRAVLGSAA